MSLLFKTTVITYSFEAVHKKNEVCYKNGKQKRTLGRGLPELGTGVQEAMRFKHPESKDVASVHGQ